LSKLVRLVDFQVYAGPGGLAFDDEVILDLQSKGEDGVVGSQNVKGHRSAS
jgi:hypothetical protein